MSRVVALFVLVLALLQGSGLDAHLSEVTCAGEHHEEEAPGADCNDECVTCACCARVTFPPLVASSLVGEPVPTAAAYGDSSANRLPSPPPRGILHVPKATA